MSTTPVITIGADPEVFLLRNGEPVSAHNILPGTKTEPYPVTCGAIQVDGLAGEFNIDPASDAASFNANIETVLNQLKTRAGLDLSIEPVAVFDEGYFKSLPEEVKELGCNPDFNAWTGQVNPSPENKEFPTMRTGSGHIHIGGWCGTDMDVRSPAHMEDCRTIAKQLDYFLGIPSLDWDKDNRRRTLYGMAGAYRPKPYGMEYRVLSNVWIRSPDMRSWIWSTAYRAMDQLMKGNYLPDRYGNLAQKIIDENVNFRSDSEWVKKNGVPSTFLSYYSNILGVRQPPVETLNIKSPNVRTSKTKKMFTPDEGWVIDDIVTLIATQRV